MEARHIVFDVGNVLLHYDPELAYLDLIPDAGERRWFLETVCSPSWNLEQDRGRGWREAEAVLIERFPDHAQAIRAFRAHWHRMTPAPIAETVTVFRALVEAGADITLLTNFAADTFEEALGRFEFLALARGATVSGRIGHVKPEPAIYAIHARQFGLAPDAIVFIDDNAANVAAADAAGWRTIRFTGAERLRGQLSGFGIDVPDPGQAPAASMRSR